MIALQYAYFFTRLRLVGRGFWGFLALRMISARPLADLSLFLGKLTPLFLFRWTSFFAELPKR